MIRVRNLDGTVLEVPKGCFVEMVNQNDGTLGAVWYRQNDSSVVKIVPGSHEAARYENLFRNTVKFGAKEITR